MQIYGVAHTCGIGFTKSHFVGSLAFENPADDQSFAAPVRLGVFGYVLVRFGAARRPEELPCERQSRESRTRCGASIAVMERLHTLREDVLFSLEGNGTEFGSRKNSSKMIRAATNLTADRTRRGVVLR